MVLVSNFESKILLISLVNLDDTLVSHHLFNRKHWLKIGKTQLFGSKRSWLFDWGYFKLFINMFCFFLFWIEPFVLTFILNYSVFAGGTRYVKKNFSSYFVANAQFIRIVDHQDVTIMHIAPWPTPDTFGHSQHGTGFLDPSIQIVCKRCQTISFEI